MECLWCDEQLRYSEPSPCNDAPRGWVHQEGGVYAMRCPICGWYGAPWPSPVNCPRCGSKQVRDDHCVTPKVS